MRGAWAAALCVAWAPSACGDATLPCADCQQSDAGTGAPDVPDGAVRGGEPLDARDLPALPFSPSLHAACGGGSVPPPAQPGKLVDVAALAGVAGPEADPCAEGPLECHATSMTGGAAVGDVDGDGYPDLYVTHVRGTDSLFLNCGDGSFADVTAAMNLTKADAPTNGASFADVDGDGDLDLFVTSFGMYAKRHYLYVLEDDGTYREDGIGRGVAQLEQGPLYGTGIAFGDYDRDGYLDLYVGEWRQDSLVPAGAPQANHARLFHNRGAERPGYFEDVTARAGLTLGGTTTNGIATLEGVFVFTPTFSDLDGDGLLDLALAADYGSSRLFWNRGDGTFEDGTELAGVGTEQAGMGSTIGDHDGDGLLDWFVTSIYESGRGYDGNRLFRNQGARRFEDITDAAGVRDVGWGWGAALVDFDLDADLDLVAVAGFTNEEGARREYPGRIALWRHPGAATLTNGGACEDVAPALAPVLTGQGRTVALLDFDRDGDQDLFVAQQRSGDLLLRNDAADGTRSLAVQLRGSRNRFGVGARVSAHAGRSRQVRELTAGSAFLGQSELVAHFAVPDGAPVTLEVRWPDDGAIQWFENVAAGRSVVIVEP